ncbi:MAG: M48 family metallopeptidase [Gammaproteobacteria bacterium]
MSARNLTRRRLLQAALASPMALYGRALWASSDDEQLFADQYWDVYLAGKDEKVPRHPNTDAERALQAIALPLCRVSTRSNLHWRVGLLKVDPRNINAFTCGGGVIFVHDSLISVCDNETDLAAVIGHEIGHNEYRHAIKRLYAAQVLAKYNIDAQWDDRQFRAALEHNMHELVADKIIYRSYTRLWEYQADAFAVRALEGGGYDPGQAAHMFQKLLGVFPDHGDIDTCLASTHPQFADRVARLQALARGYARVPARKDSAAFRTLVQLVG